jgi:hypothetical protein
VSWAEGSSGSGDQGAKEVKEAIEENASGLLEELGERLRRE